MRAFIEYGSTFSGHWVFIINYCQSTTEVKLNEKEGTRSQVNPPHTVFGRYVTVCVPVGGFTFPTADSDTELVVAQ